MSLLKILFSITKQKQVEEEEMKEKRKELVMEENEKFAAYAWWRCCARIFQFQAVIHHMILFARKINSPSNHTLKSWHKRWWFIGCLFHFSNSTLDILVYCAFHFVLFWLNRSIIFLIVFFLFTEFFIVFHGNKSTTLEVGFYVMPYLKTFHFL